MQNATRILTVALTGMLALSAGCTSDMNSTQAHTQDRGADANATPTYAKPSTQKAPDSAFVTREEDGRLWVFYADSEELKDFDEKGELAKHITRPKAGPDDVTLKAPDTETINAYLAVHGDDAESRFVTREDDGRLWVFYAGSEELQDFDEKGELAKHITRPKAGPDGVTLKAPDTETIDAYLAAMK